MAELIIQTEAIKIASRPGGYATRTVVDSTKTALGTDYRTHRHEVTEERVKGSDRAIFVCPWCERRNNQSVYRHKSVTEQGNLTFRCAGCRREIEVSKPREIATILIPTNSNPIVSGLYGPDNRPVDSGGI